MKRLLLALAVFAVSAQQAGAATWACESLNNAYRECRIGTGGVIRLVMELSDRACFEGLTWGTREGGMVWVDRGCRATFTVDNGDANRRVVCESQDGRRQLCLVEPVHDVALLRQLSKTPCVEFDNWGFNPDRNSIWVDRGCRGEFMLGKIFGPRFSGSKGPALDGSVICESLDGRRKVCPADTSGGVQIVRNLEGTNCRFGKEWTYDRSGIAVNKGCRAEFAIKGSRPKIPSLVCESKNNARASCAGDVRYGVALVREFGNNDCILEKTWGFDAEGVWVTDGCRAQFALGGYRLPPDAVPASAAKVVCESADGPRTLCAADTTRGVGLVRQTSEADCILNRTWGYDRAGIWVSGGCKAEFAVAR